jgi:oligosaccharyltransferase complex subunit beta
MKFLTSIASLLLAAVSAVQAVSVSGPRLLAVFDDLADKDTYSTFLGDLEGLFAPFRSMNFDQSADTC